MEKTYSETFVVRATDCDVERRMRLSALFVAMQEGGERHADVLSAPSRRPCAASRRPLGGHPSGHPGGLSAAIPFLLALAMTR